MLTNAKVLSLKARNAPYKVSDGGGLYVFVQPTGSKLWRLAYRFQGKQRTASFGAYPTVSLAGARTHRDEIKALLKAGQDPATAARMISKTVRTFRVVAAEWEQKKVIAEGRSAIDHLPDALAPEHARGRHRRSARLPRSSRQSCWKCCARSRPAAYTRPSRAYGQRPAHVFRFGIASRLLQT